MKNQYFVRYHGHENVVTENTMFLLRKIYCHSQSLYFEFLKSLNIVADKTDFELQIKTQVKSEKSVPDAVICQDSYKIVLETKLDNVSFTSKQLKNHLAGFKNETSKVLLTLAPQKMTDKTKKEFEKELYDFNKKNKNTSEIFHVNTTFENIIDTLRILLQGNDTEINAILDDYYDFCCENNLIPESQNKVMIQPCRKTYDFNIENKIYYNSSGKNFKKCDYLGLYCNKAVRGFAKIKNIVTAIEQDGEIEIKPFGDFKEIPENAKEIISKAMDFDDKEFGKGNSIRNKETRYYFVDEFYELEFRREKNYPQSVSYITLSEYIENYSKEMTDKQIAEKLNNQKWHLD